MAYLSKHRGVEIDEAISSLDKFDLENLIEYLTKLKNSMNFNESGLPTVQRSGITYLDMKEGAILVPRIEVKDVATFGNFAFITRDNKNLSFKKVVN